MFFQQGLFPESLISGSVTPVYKNDNPQIPSNYRPISILSVFKKSSEKCMYSHLYSFMLNCKVLCNKTFGFRNNYPTNHVQINQVDLIEKYLDNEYYVCEVFIDL